MQLLRIPGIVAYALMAMQLLQVAAAPALARAGAGDRLAEIRAALIGHGAPASAKVTLAAPDAVRAVVEQAPGLVILDEAYIEYAGHSWAREAPEKSRGIARSPLRGMRATK